MPSPFAGWGDFFNVEYRVNGVWNNLFFTKFQAVLGYDPKKYIVCAETYPSPENTQGLMMDLTVNQLVQENGGMRIDYSYVAYEGKGKKSKSFDQIEAQLNKYFARAKADGGQFECWAIGTRGKQTAFYYYNNDHDAMDYQKIAQNSPGKYTLVNANSRVVYDITSDTDWTEIDAVMTWIAAKAPR